MDAYGKVSARIRFVPNDGALSLTVFANNLLDETCATYAQRFGGGLECGERGRAGGAVRLLM